MYCQSNVMNATALKYNDAVANKYRKKSRAVFLCSIFINFTIKVSGKQNERKPRSLAGREEISRYLQIDSLSATEVGTQNDEGKRVSRDDK